MKEGTKTMGSGAPQGSAAPQAPRPEPQTRSRRSIYWILGGLVIAGILAGYNWLRSLPRD